jgi:hypothetical protein
MSLGSSIAIASAGFLAPVTAARAFRRMLLAGIGFVALVVVLSALDFLSPGELRSLRKFAIVPGIPVGAAILAEMALRDAMTQRTLLYTLLGPVSRARLAATRTVWTAMLLALGIAALLVVLQMLLASMDGLIQRLLAAVFGSLAYVGIFGWIHLLTRRGTIASLALYATFDHAIGMLPFSIRMIAPSYHLRVLGEAQSAFPIPFLGEPAKSTPWLASLVLLAIAALATFLSARLFARKNLPELC